MDKKVRVPKVLDDAIYRILWDIYKCGYNDGKKDIYPIEIMNKKLRIVSRDIIKFIKENGK